jgi:uncharacterized membrane protein
MTWTEYLWLRFVSDLVYAGVGLCFVAVICVIAGVLRFIEWRRMSKKSTRYNPPRGK